MGGCRTPRQGRESAAGTILYTSAEALRVVTALAHPIIPEATARIWYSWGWARSARWTCASFGLGTVATRHQAGQGRRRLPTRRQEQLERMQQMEQERSQTRTVTETKQQRNRSRGNCAPRRRRLRKRPTRRSCGVLSGAIVSPKTSPASRWPHRSRGFRRHPPATTDHH